MGYFMHSFLESDFSPHNECAVLSPDSVYTMGEFGSGSLEVGVRANSAPPPVYPTSPVLAVPPRCHWKCRSGVTLDLPSTHLEPIRSLARDEQVHTCPSPWGVPGAPATTKTRPLVGLCLQSWKGSGGRAWAGEGGFKTDVILRGLATRICWRQSPSPSPCLGTRCPLIQTLGGLLPRCI